MRKNLDLVIFCSLAAAGVLIFHIGSAIIGFPHYRDQHLGAALHYAKHGINWLHPVIPGFNALGTGTPQELPLWQALASLPLRFSSWWGWANVISLGVFAPAGWVAYELAKSWLGDRRAALWVLLAFICQPILILMSGQASTDGLALTFSILTFLAFVKFVDASSWRWAVAAAFLGPLAALTKLPFFMASGLAAAFYALWRNPPAWKRLVVLAGIGVLCAAIFWTWNSACDKVLRAAEFPHAHLSLSDNPAMVRWYFGDLEFRLNPANYIKAGWAALCCLWGSFALVGIALLGVLTRARKPALCLLAGGLITTWVFLHLVLVHRHYYVLFSFPVALLVGAGLSHLERLMAKLHSSVKATFPGAAAVCLGLAAAQGLIGMEVVLNYDPYPHRIAAEIRKHTRPGERLLIQGGGWGGNILMLGNLDGLTIWADKILKSENLPRLKELGFTKVILISESPLLWALKKTNPGAGGLNRVLHRDVWSPLLDNWPTLVETEDLIIKEIPSF